MHPERFMKEQGFDRLRDRDPCPSKTVPTPRGTVAGNVGHIMAHVSNSLECSRAILERFIGERGPETLPEPEGDPGRESTLGENLERIHNRMSTLMLILERIYKELDRG